MMDAFAVLGLPRKAVLESREIERAYMTAAAAGVGEAADAYRVVKDAVLRLRHLLQLLGHEGKERESGALPAAAARLFDEIAPVLEEYKKLQEELEGTVSALERAALMPRVARMSGRLQGLLNALEEAGESWDEKLQYAQGEREAAELDVEFLAECLRERVFVERWRGRINESLFRLTAAA